MPRCQPIVQHVADRVVAGPEHLRVEVSNHAQHQRPDHRRPDQRVLDRQIVEEILQPRQHPDHDHADHAHQNPQHRKQPQFRHAGQPEGRRGKQRRPSRKVNPHSRRHRRRERHRNKRARPQFEQQQLHRHQNSRHRRGKCCRHSRRCARRQQHAPIVRRQPHRLSEQRSNCRAGLNDRPLRAERSACPDRERRRQRLQNRHANAHAALPEQHRLHRLWNPVPLQRGLPEINHDAHQQTANRRNQNHPQSQVIVRGVRNREGELPVEKQIREEVNQLQQPLRHQSGDKSHQQRVRADPNHLRLQRDSELSLLVRLRLRSRGNLRDRKLSHYAIPFHTDRGALSLIRLLAI